MTVIKDNGTTAPARDDEQAVANLAAYKFVQLGQPEALRTALLELTHRHHLRGTILLSTEGINLFVAGAVADVDSLIGFLHGIDELSDLEIKWSYSPSQPFRRMLVKVKQEIIAFGVDGIEPAKRTSRKIAAAELCQWLDEGRDVTLLDVRNDYEVRLGTFQNAVSIGVDHFRQFPDAVRRIEQLSKRRPVVMFCTGGIRCEKAGPFMENAGFEEVYQLDGGILRYFEQCGGKHYEGECFVFDQRVSLDPSLHPTDARLCFACRSPLTVEDQQSDRYVPDECCPYCYLDPKQRMALAIKARHKRLLELTSPPPGCIPYENRRFITVHRALDGGVLIDFLMDVFPFPGVEAWQQRIDEGLVRRDGAKLAANSVVSYGDRIENLFPDTVEPQVNCGIRILYEDDSIVVVDKPAPLPMHPCGRFNRNTLASILSELYRPQKLRLAHRLDANTTGVVIFSRTKKVATAIQTQFHIEGQVRKQYIVRVVGHPSWDSYASNATIGPSKSGQVGARMVAGAGGQSATTHFAVLHRLNDGTALLLARPLTGRTNQIRIHCWHLGFPVVGDPTYLVDGKQGTRRTLDPDAAQMCLHAWQIEFDHPDGYRATFEAPLPEWAPVE
jgi:UPF0176 protein